MDMVPLLEVEISLVQKLLDEALIHETISLRGVAQNESILVRLKLRDTKAILKDIDYKKRFEDERVRGWILEVREVVRETEDVVEMFLVNEGSSRRRGLFQSFITKWRDKTNFEEIHSIWDKVNSLMNHSPAKDLVPDTDLRIQEELPGRLPYGEKVVGMEDEVKKLLRESVLDEQKKGLSIAVVEGMVGIGKTTLAHQIYNHPDVVTRFECRAWVVVSSDKVTVLEETMKQLILLLAGSDKEEFQEMLHKQLQGFQEMLHKQLQGKKYFIVLDDVREVEHWESLKAAFPDEQGTASRLLLTTRNKYIATYDRRYTHYEMKLLDPEESWELFAMKAALIDGGCSEELEPIGREIVKRCEGIPLTICTLGGLLAVGRTKMEWEQVLNQISFHLGSSGFEILKSSYQNLSPALQSCFLRLAFFKEGATIPAKALLHIWCIQGLIQNDRRRTMEERARDYLDELTNRNMLQIVGLTMEDRAKNVYVHGVLREVLLEERTKVALRLETVKEAEGMISSEHEVRHRVLYGGNLETLSRSRSKYLRSIFLLNNEGEGVGVDVSSLSHDFWMSCQLLSILYLDGINFSTFPDSLRALVRLKYLMIRRHKIHSKCALDVEDYLEAVKLPNWLDDLKHLKIVDMEGEKVEFPNDVALKMEWLSYFSAYCVRGPISINTWKRIETLKYIRLEDWMECSRQTFLCNVRKLGLFLDPLSKPDKWRKMRASLERLAKLEHLQLRWNRFIPIDPQIIPNLRTLTKLKLRGKLTKCPDATIFPPNLSCLTLAFSDLSEDLMAEMSKLPRLSYLKLLGNTYKPERMQVLSADGFPCLEVLTLKEMFHLKSIDIQQGGMPRLQKLRIQHCPSLQTMNLPEDVIIKRIS